MVDLTTKVRVPEKTVFHVLDGETVLLNLDSGKYFGLDPVGTRMWELLEEKGCLEAAIQPLLDEYDVRQEKLQEDLITLVTKLVDHGLLEVVEG